jgi:hypothetical protein
MSSTRGHGTGLPSGQSVARPTLPAHDGAFRLRDLLVPA